MGSGSCLVFRPLDRIWQSRQRAILHGGVRAGNLGKSSGGGDGRLSDCVASGTSLGKGGGPSAAGGSGTGGAGVEPPCMGAGDGRQQACVASCKTRCHGAHRGTRKRVHGAAGPTGGPVHYNTVASGHRCWSWRGCLGAHKGTRQLGSFTCQACRSGCFGAYRGIRKLGSFTRRANSRTRKWGFCRGRELGLFT